MIPMRGGLLAVAAAALLVSPTQVAAQNAGDAAARPPADGRVTVTLEEALDLARQYNPDLRQAANGLERAAAAERSSWGAMLPEIGISGSLSGSSSRTQTGRNEYGQPVALEDAATFSSTSGSGSLSASLVVFDGFRRVNQLQAARAGGRVADALYDSEAARVEAEVRRRFYTALGMRRMVEVERRLLAAAEERLDAMRAMVPAGRTTPQDVLGAEADLAAQEMALDQAVMDEYDAQLALREIVGLEEAVALEPVGEFPELVDPAGYDRDELLARALRASPRMRAARHSADRAAHSADAARAGRWPTVSIGAGLSRGVSVSQVDQLSAFPWNRGFGVSLSASMPIFTGFRASEQVVAARTAEADADEDLRRAELAVERAVRSAIGGVELAFGAVRLAERTADLALERAEIGQEGFRRGLIGFTALQQQIDRAALAERRVAGAYLSYARAMATLREVIGGDPSASAQGGEDASDPNDGA